MFMDFEEFEGDDDIREEFPCPFCSEYFDILGLCCHIDDEHSVDARNGVLLSFLSFDCQCSHNTYELKTQISHLEVHFNSRSLFAV